MEIEVFKNICPPDWDESLYSAGLESNLSQSEYWGSLMIDLDGAVPYYLIVKNGNEVVAQALFIKFIVKYNLKKIITLARPYLECVDGPVILDNDYAVEAMKLILKEIKRIALTNLISHVEITLSQTSSVVTSPDVLKVVSDSGYSSKKWGTYLIDTGKDEDEIFKSIDKKAREKVNKARKMGLTVSTYNQTEEFVRDCIDVYESAGIKTNIDHRLRRTLEMDSKNYYQFYLVKDPAGRNLAVVGSYIFNKVATRMASSLSPVCREENIPAQDLITWESIADAHRRGCLYFNMAGVNPDSTDTKELGVRKFKEKWGGDYSEYPVFRKDVFRFPFFFHRSTK